MGLALGAPPDAPAQAPQPAATASAPSITRRVPGTVVRGVEAGELPEDPSAFTTVIDVKDHVGEIDTTEELLGRTVGVQVRSFGGPGDPAEISIRGSTSSQVVVQLNGIRLNTAQSGRVDLSTIPLAMLDRIEVTRGGGSVQAGSDAVGGVVNLVTLSPGGETTTRLVGTAGEYGTWEGSIARAGTLRGIEYVAGYDVFSTDGDWKFDRKPIQTAFGKIKQDPDRAKRINNDSESHAVLLGLGRDLGDHVHVSFTDSFFRESEGVPGFDDGSGPKAGQQPNARQRLLRNLSHLRIEGADLGVEGLGAALDLAYLHEKAKFRDPDEVPQIDTSDRNGTWTGRLRGDIGLPVAFTQHGISSEFEVRRDTLDSNSFGNVSRNTWGLVLQDDISLWEGRLRLLPALRHDDTEGFGTEWLPRIGLVAEVLPGLRLKANLEKSYRVPNFQELYLPDLGFIRGNPNLRSEESTDGDVGFQLAFARLGPLRNVSLEGAYFRREIDESIVFLQVSPSLVQPENTGSATIEGFEIGASLDLLGWLRVSANHTYLDTEVDATGTPLPGRADNETNLRIELGPPSRLAQLVVEMQATDKIPVTDTGNTTLPSRTTWDAAVSVDLAKLDVVRERLPFKELRLTVEGFNLTDEYVRSALYLPQPGRSWAVRLATAW